MDESRFARMEKRLDDLADAKIRLTMLEERQMQNSKSLERAFNEIESNSNKIRKMETTQAINNTKLGFSERIIWFFVSGVFGAVGYLVNHL
jgi:hypothetical protein